jgi:hypothetical protein
MAGSMADDGGEDWIEDWMDEKAESLQVAAPGGRWRRYAIIG